jgi:disulfide bond formation protein DsbB
MERISTWLERSALFIALLAAAVAMLGSLYFSEVKGYLPCVLCWYQRILMYPLTGILAMGLVWRVRQLPKLILPFAVLGFGIAGYHYLLEKTDLFDASVVCRAGVSCTTVWINWFGFVTIPLLALTAFLIIALMCVVAIMAGEPQESDEDGEPLPAPWLPVVAILAVVGVVFGYLWVTGTVDPVVAAQNAALADEAAGSVAPSVVAPSLVVSDTILPADVTPGPMSAVVPASPETLAQGKLIYELSCATCHGIDGAGVSGLGNALVGTEYMAATGDEELLAMIIRGRAKDDPANVTGVAMPERGGASVSDEVLQAVVSYVRTLK